MNKKDKKIESKEEPSEQLKNEKLSELMRAIISFMILTCLFGYIGYTFCIDNNYDVQRGIVFGAIFPLGLAILKELNFGNIFTYIVYFILYIIVLENIPTFVGIIVLFIFILMFIINFIFIIKKDKKENINKSYQTIQSKTSESLKYSALNNNYEYLNNHIYGKSEDKENEYKIQEDEEELECEMCLKKISEEEYELYDGMCEECFSDIHIDEHGNYHDDPYWKY